MLSKHFCFLKKNLIFPGSAAVAQLAVNTIFCPSYNYMAKDKRKYSDRAEYLKQAVVRRRKKIRQLALEYKSNRCLICGYDRCLNALEFHHLDSSKKDFGISAKGYTRSWEVIKTELDKCVLLCANCHREVHEDPTQLLRVIEVEKQGELLEA